MRQLDILVRLFAIGNEDAAFRLLVPVQAESPADVKYLFFVRQDDQVIPPAERIVFVQVVFDKADQVKAVLDLDIGPRFLKERIR